MKVGSHIMSNQLLTLFSGLIMLCVSGTAKAASALKAYSMLTHDGRRLVSHVEGTNTVFELVHTNALPANLPPVREWTLYAVKSAHTDIGLHNSQYIQRHGTVRRIDEARRLIAADPDDSDPAAFRYVAEGAWFWGNYPLDRGEAEAMAVVTNEIARGRLDVDSPTWNVQLLTLKRAEDGRGLIARFREREGRPCRVTASQHLAPDAEYTLCNVIERDVRKLDGFAFDLAPFGYATIRIDAPSLRFDTRPPDDSAYAYTGLITAPRAGHGEKDGQMYILWGAEMSPDFDHYELWRDGKFLVNVTNEVPNGIPYRVARYVDLGLPTHSRHEYCIRKVWKDGRKDPLCESFYGLTRFTQANSNSHVRKE